MDRQETILMEPYKLLPKASNYYLCDLKYKKQNPRVAAFSIGKFFMFGNGVSNAIIIVVGGGPSEECFSADHRWKWFTSVGW